MLVHKHCALISMNEAKPRFHVSVSPASRRRALLQARRAAPYRHARKRQCPVSSSARWLLQSMNKQPFRILHGAVQFHLVASPHPAHDVEGRPLLIPLKQELQESRDCIARYLRARRRRPSREQECLASGYASNGFYNWNFASVMIAGRARDGFMRHGPQRNAPRGLLRSAPPGTSGANRDPLSQAPDPSARMRHHQQN